MFGWLWRLIGIDTRPLVKRGPAMRKPKCTVCHKVDWEQTGSYRIGSGRPTMPVRCRACGTKATLQDTGSKWDYPVW